MDGNGVGCVSEYDLKAVDVEVWRQIEYIKSVQSVGSRLVKSLQAVRENSSLLCD